MSQFVARGQKTVGSKYFYMLTGHCNSIASVSDNSGTEVTTINYTPYGSPLIALASFIPDFGYAGYYLHQRSGLNLTRYRAYNPSLGRWICRDPAGPQGSNLHGYANNNPVCFTDPSGLTTQVCCSDFTRAEIRNLTDQIAVHAHLAVRNVSNRISTFMDLFIGGSENTIFGNRVDREFKFLVTRDVSLGRHPLNIHANYGAGPDITTDCPDIFWEITSIGAAPDHGQLK